MSIFKKLAEVFIRFPGLTQGAVASVLQVTGDVIAQKVFEKRENLDLRRSFKFAVLGFFSGYVQMKWYGYLYTRFQGKNLVRTLKKLAGEFPLHAHDHNAKNFLIRFTFLSRPAGLRTRLDLLPDSVCYVHRNRQLWRHQEQRSQEACQWVSSFVHMIATSSSFDFFFLRLQADDLLLLL